MADPDALTMLRDIHRETVTQKSPSRSFMAEEGAIAKQLRHWRDQGCKDGFGHGLWKQFAELGLTVGDAAARLGVSRVTLSRVIHGHAGVSPNLAVRLERAGVGTARAWLAMQSNYDLARVRAEGDPDVRPLVVA